MKKIVISLIAASLFSSQAMAKGDSKIAIIVMEKLQEKSEALKDLNAKLTKQKAIYESEIAAKATALQKNLANVKDSKAKSKGTQTKQIEQEFVDMQNEAREKGEILEIARSDSLEKINDKVKEIVSDIAKQEKYQLVLSSGSLFYYPDDYENDITDDVVKQLNKKMSTVDVSFVKKTSAAEVKK